MMSRTYLERDRESYVRGFFEDIDGSRNVNDFRPAFRALKHYSKSTPLSGTIRKAGVQISKPEGYRASWPDLLEQLYWANP